MRKIFLFFAAILCSVSAWAYDLAAGQYVYFEKPADWSNVSLLLGHNSWSQGYNMTKITNTNLYYWKTDSWDGYTRYCFIDATGWGGESKKPDDRKGYASHSTNVFTNQLIKYHLFTSSGSKSSHASDRKIAINRTQTIKVQLKDGENWVDATVVPADLTASTYAMTDNSTAVSAASASLTKESTIVSATVSAAYSATVTLACTNVLDGYVFEGWYDANGNKITSYTVSDAHTVQARFIQSAEETNEVSVSYVCDATTVSSAIAEFVGVETEKSFTAPTVTGYQFTNWTIGGGMTLTEGTATDATITVVTKSASSDYTLVANYEEVMETVYFINANKWARVNIYKWGGNAEDSSWPGEQLTASGEQIGECDVYAYTAKQGDYANVIFNSKTSPSDGGNDQTGDLTWADGVNKYYIYNYSGNTGWYTQAEAEEKLKNIIVIAGTVNSASWAQKELVGDNTTASIVLALAADSTYEFKMIENGTWLGNDGTMTRVNDNQAWTFGSDANCKITTDVAGDYTFTWNFEKDQLTVTYPELSTYTVAATAENGTIEGIENEGVYTQGDEVTLTATAAEGYHFVKWDDESTDNPRIITVTEDVTLQAIFEINNYTITASTTREKLTQTIAIDGDNADWANIPMLSEPGVGPMVKMVVPQEGTTLPEGAAFALMVQGDHEQILAGYPVIYTDADKSIATGGTSSSYPNMGKDYEMATWTDGSLYGTNSTNTIREMSIAKDAFSSVPFDGSVYAWLTFAWGELYLPATPSNNDWKWSESVYHPYDVKPYTFNDLASTHTAVGAFNTHEALTPGESLQLSKGGHDTALWVSWAVELTQPAIYNISANIVATNSTSLDLYLVDIKTNTIVATREGAKKEAPQAEFEYGEWDLTNVPAGKYMLKAKNHVQYSNMVFTSVTLTPQGDVVTANTVTGSGNYNHGAEVTLTATPATGYEFVEWSDGETANPYTFTASEEVNLTATFQKKSYTVTIVKEATNQTIAIDGNNSDWAKIPMLSEPGVSPMVKMIVPQEGVSLPDGAAFALMVQGDEEYIKAEYPKIYTDYDKSNTTGSVRWWCNAMGSDLSVTKSTSGTLYNANAESTIREMCVMQSSFSMPFTGSVWTWLYFEGSDVFVPQNASEAGWAWSETSCFPLDVKSYSYTDIANTHAANTVYANHSALIFDKTIQFNKLYYWAAWAVELITPAVYTISMDVSATNTTTLDLYLVNVATNEVVKTFVGEEKWAPEGEIAYGEWDLSDVPVGKYMLKAMSHTSGTDMQITSVTLTPQESNVEIESAEHILTGDGTYLYGEVATLNATPATGYNFVNWSNGKTANPYSFIVTKDVEIAANFEKLTYTVTATATNGTVTGAGTYEHGEEVTLTATPAFDYQFVKWSNESTENPLTITVEDNIELQAIFAEVAATTVAESGVFSISAHKTATFATGNLQYNVGTDTWRFAKQQYQVVGEQNINLGDPAFTGWIDMLGWSNGEANNYGVNPSNVNELYDGEFEDWGTKMGEEWSTLSAEEWSYLLNTRENAASLKQTAKVDTILGLLLFPDGWVMPEDVVVEAEMDEYFEVNIYNYTLEQWTKLEQAGAIFLPAAGRRAGGYGNMINYDQVEETDPEMLNGGYYRHQDNTNIYCYYWTSTINEETKNVSYLNNIVHLGNEEYTIGTGAIWIEKGRYGQSVRLAKVVWDTHTVTATAENGTVEGAGEYAHGAEVTLTATANEGYEFVKWSNESTENPLTITVTEDVTISAIFQEVVPVITYTVKWYTAVGETTEVTLEKGADITKPATDPEMEGYVFMGWTDECFVAEDGSDFTAIEDFGTADADKEYYAVFAVKTTTDGGGDETGSVTMKYSGSTSNMIEGNNAETVGLDANEWSVVPTKGGASNMPGLNKDGEIRLYGHADGGNYLTISSKSYTITDVTITYTSESYNNGKFYVNGNETDASNINANEFVIKNANFGTTQVRIKSLVINYTSTSGEPTTTYSNYMTTCTPEEYTIDWSVNGEVAESTIVVEGDALVLPEAPAAPDACSEKVFMGWATTATVNADGSAITWVNDTIVPESDNTYYAVFATKTVDEENSEAGSVTLAYKGSTTTNMTVDGNNAATVGLNAEEWSVTAAKGGNNNAPGLNKDGSIRLYYAASGSNTITVTSTVEGLTIGSITITYTNDNNNGKVLVNGETINGTDGTYTINANSFVITNGNTSNVQVHIESIVIEYAKPAISYIDYSTICVVPEEYTVTFDYSVDAGYITVNDVRISEKVVKYAEGTVLTVKALTFDNYRFDAWMDEEAENELSITPEYTFTVTGDVVLKASITYIPGAVGTGVENNNVVSSKTMKVIQNGRLMIIREGKTYNAQGQMIE